MAIEAGVGGLLLGRLCARLADGIKDSLCQHYKGEGTLNLTSRVQTILTLLLKKSNSCFYQVSMREIRYLTPSSLSERNKSIPAVFLCGISEEVNSSLASFIFLCDFIK